MELNGTTLILEIINFLVLIWLLKHFFYSPILAFLDNRKLQIEQRLQQAEQRHEDAEKLESDYKEKLSKWQQEKEQAQQALQQELQTQRQEALRKLQDQLSEERAKSEAVNHNRQLTWMKQQQRQSHRQATRFVSTMLSDMSTPVLENLLIERAIDQLKHLPHKQQETFSSAAKQPGVSLNVTSRFSMSEPHKQALISLFQTWIQADVSVHFEQDESLLCGLLIEAGAWVLRMNIRDELQSFSELAYESMEGTTG